MVAANHWSVGLTRVDTGWTVSATHNEGLHIVQPQQLFVSHGFSGMWKILMLSVSRDLTGDFMEVSSSGIGKNILGMGMGMGMSSTFWYVVLYLKTGFLSIISCHFTMGKGGLATVDFEGHFQTAWPLLKDDGFFADPENQPSWGSMWNLGTLQILWTKLIIL